MIKKLFLFFVIVILISQNAFADNWYAVTTYYMVGKDGGKFTIRMVTKTYDEDTCYKVMEMHMDPVVGKVQWVDTECVTGIDYDIALSEVFNKRPAEEAYLYIVDEYGLEKVIDFMDVPEELHGALALALVKKLKKENVQLVEIVQPEEKQTEKTTYEKTGEFQTSEFFDRGSTKNEVRAVQGAPDVETDATWFYGDDYVAFDKKGKVKDIINLMGSLKTKETRQ